MESRIGSSEEYSIMNTTTTTFMSYNSIYNKSTPKNLITHKLRVSKKPSITHTMKESRTQGKKEENELRRLPLEGKGRRKEEGVSSLPPPLLSSKLNNGGVGESVGED